MTYKEFCGLYSRKKTPEQGFVDIYNEVKSMLPEEKLKMKAFLDREIEVFNHLERGINILSIILTLMLAVADLNTTKDVGLWSYVLLIAIVIVISWCIIGGKRKYVYLMSVIDNIKTEV